MKKKHILLISAGFVALALSTTPSFAGVTCPSNKVGVVCTGNSCDILGATKLSDDRRTILACLMDATAQLDANNQPPVGTTHWQQYMTSDQTVQKNKSNVTGVCTVVLNTGNHYISSIMGNGCLPLNTVVAGSCNTAAASGYTCSVLVSTNNGDSCACTYVPPNNNNNNDDNSNDDNDNGNDSAPSNDDNSANSQTTANRP